MNLYIYREAIRKVRGEEREFLDPIAELEGYEDETVALEALVDQMPELLGTEFVVFTDDPQYITVEPPPEAKYNFRRRNGNVVTVEDEPQSEPEVEPEPVETVTAVATKPRAKKRPAKKPAAKKPAAKGDAKRRPGRSPFKSNPASAE